MNISDYRTITYFDVETTSLNPELGEIIQICIVTEDRDGNLEEWSTKIRPRLAQGTYQKSALRINNFVPKEWIDAQSLKKLQMKLWLPLTLLYSKGSMKVLRSIH